MLEELIEELRTFVDERDWSQYHDPKNLTMALASEVGELAQLIRWVPNSNADSWAQDPKNREALENEVADVAITLFMLVERLNMNLPEAMRRKLDINRRNYPADLVRGSSERPKRSQSSDLYVD